MNQRMDDFFERIEVPTFAGFVTIARPFHNDFDVCGFEYSLAYYDDLDRP